MLNKKCFALLLGLSVITGCSHTGDTKTETRSAKEIYQSAQTHIHKERYVAAIDDLDALESNYPYGEYADKSQLALIYAYYESHDPASALATAEHFIQMYPRHKHVDYAYYMKGLSKFSEPLEGLSKYLPMNPADRDIQPVREAFFYFAELVQRFPNSPYVNDSIRRMVYLKNALAGNEIGIAKTYYARKAYIAASKRAQTVLLDYPDTQSTEEALYILARCYKKLGMPDLETQTRDVLAHNFPKSKYL